MPTSINFKLLSPCSGGGHYSIDLTPGPTVTLSVDDVRDWKDRIDALSTAQRTALSLALHANVNDLSLAQVRTETAAVAGLDLVL